MTSLSQRLLDLATTVRDIHHEALAALNIRPLMAASAAALALLTPTSLPAILTAHPGQGTFYHFTTGEYLAAFGRALSADMAFDPGQKVMVASATGAWVRPFWKEPVTDYMFGATDGADNADKLEDWSKFVWNVRCIEGRCISKGTSNRGITLGGTSVTNSSATPKLHIGVTINATAAMDILLLVKNTRRRIVEHACDLFGSAATTDGVALAGRLAKYGIAWDNVQYMIGTGLARCHNFYYFGAVAHSTIGASPLGGNNNFAVFPQVTSNYCGSSKMEGGSHCLTANWSSPVRVGSAGPALFTQTSTIIVGAIPLADPLNAQDNISRLAWINGYPYRIAGEPASNGDGTWTLTLTQPWIDDTSYAAGAGSGTLTYTFGGKAINGGSDTSATRWRGIGGIVCGYAFLDTALYGATVDRLDLNSGEDIYYAFGNGPSSAHLGGRIVAGYGENIGSVQILGLSAVAKGIVFPNVQGTILDFTKWIQHGPRCTDGQLSNQVMSNLIKYEGYEGKLIVAGYGPAFSMSYDPPSLAAGASVQTTMSIPGGVPVGQTMRANWSLGNLRVDAQVTAINATKTSSTVTFTLTNLTGATLDAASGTLSATLLQ